MLIYDPKVNSLICSPEKAQILRALPACRVRWIRYVPSSGFKTGPDFAKWLADASAMHKQLMEQAGFIGR